MWRKLLLLPPYSLDLTPSDIFPLTTLKNSLRGRRFVSSDEVIAHKNTYLGKFFKFIDVFRVVQKKWRNVSRIVWVFTEDYFEKKNLLWWKTFMISKREEPYWTTLVPNVTKFIKIRYWALITNCNSNWIWLPNNCSSIRLQVLSI